MISADTNKIQVQHHALIKINWHISLGGQYF